MYYIYIYILILIHLAMSLFNVCLCWLHNYPITIRLSGSIVITTEPAASSTSLDPAGGSRGRMDLSCKSRRAKVRDVWQREYVQEPNGFASKMAIESSRKYMF